MAAAEGTVLVIHDGSELDFTGLKSIATLGPIGNGGNRGYVAHNVLAVVAETREVLGLASALGQAAQGDEKETRKERQQRADRESRWWKTASKQIPLPLLAACKWRWPTGRRRAGSSGFCGVREEALPGAFEAQPPHFPGKRGGNEAARLCPQTSGKRTPYCGSGGDGPTCGRTATVAVSWAKVTC